LGAVEDERFIFVSETGSESGEEAFRVVAGQGGFGENSFSRGLEGGEENTGFHLSTGDLAGEADCFEAGSTNGERGTVSCAFTNQFGAKLAERFGNSFHRATGERGISEKAGGKREASNDTGEESHGGAAVTAVDWLGGRK
jgi:hypothetical protein